MGTVCHWSCWEGPQCPPDCPLRALTTGEEVWQEASCRFKHHPLLWGFSLTDISRCTQRLTELPLMSKWWPEPALVAYPPNRNKAAPCCGYGLLMIQSPSFWTLARIHQYYQRFQSIKGGPREWEKYSNEVGGEREEGILEFVHLQMYMYLDNSRIRESTLNRKIFYSGCA